MACVISPLIWALHTYGSYTYILTYTYIYRLAAAQYVIYTFFVSVSDPSPDALWATHSLIFILQIFFFFALSLLSPVYLDSLLELSGDHARAVLAADVLCDVCPRSREVRKTCVWPENPQWIYICIYTFSIPYLNLCMYCASVYRCIFSMLLFAMFIVHGFSPFAGGNQKKIP